MELWQVFVILAVVSVLPLIWGLLAQRSYIASLDGKLDWLEGLLANAEKDCEESDLELADMVEQRDKAQGDALHATNKLRDFETEMKRAKDDAARSERDYLALKQQFEQMKELRNAWERKFNEVKVLAEEEHAKVNFLKLQIDAGIGREDKLAHELRQMREKYNEAHAQLCQADDLVKEIEALHKKDWDQFQSERQQWAKALDAQQKRVEELERNVSLADARGYDEGRQAMFELFESHMRHVKQNVFGVIGSHDDLTTVGCG